MGASAMRCVRIWFAKEGRAKYISHLDIVRCMSRAVRRAGLPLWYTEGFNPHPYMMFALPLSLGFSSRCESMDIRIEGEMPVTEIGDRMRAVMPEGLRILSVREPVMQPGEIAFADYSATLFFDAPGQAAAFLHGAGTALAGGSLIVQKPGKAGHRKVMKEVDLLPLIQNCSMEQKANAVLLKLILPAGNTTNISPVLLLDALEEKAGVQDARREITRMALLTKDMETFQ